MSHRTTDLPPLTGIAHVIRELRYHEVARQMLAVVLIVVYAVTAVPVPLLAAIGLPIGVVGALVRLYASGFIVKNQAARDRRSVSIRAPSAVHGQHLARRRLRARGLALVGHPARAVVLLVLLPDGDRVRRPQAAPHLRHGLGAMVGTHAGAAAALRRLGGRQPPAIDAGR